MAFAAIRVDGSVVVPDAQLLGLSRFRKLQLLVL